MDDKQKLTCSHVSSRVATHPHVPPCSRTKSSRRCHVQVVCSCGSLGQFSLQSNSVSLFCGSTRPKASGWIVYWVVPWVRRSCCVSMVVWSCVAQHCMWRAAPRTEWHVSLFRRCSPPLAGWHVTRREIFSPTFLEIGSDLCLRTRILTSFPRASFGEFPLTDSQFSW